ncbi:nodulation receptor kinase-like isoform X2 [Salvia hispanica]|uniref:nodulation receptor kinase-like isoform X2 n=1 Tax=Salvia hispanica TaxID=49212 RepID=UPI0020096286|nr:nodulation receptor kinase-like isoform X2 [Salvia hispanica]
MMEELDIANTRLITCCIFLIFLLVNSSYAQEGSLSIQCCADTAFTDPNTTISYISDETWYPDNKSCQNTVWTGDVNQETNEARYFESGYNSKWCYSLPTRNGSSYLIRGTFPLSNPLESSPSGNFFSVSVGETEIERVNSSSKRVEGLFTAMSNYTNFCLVKGKGEAYLSKLELRPSNTVYLARYNSSVLKLVDRVDVGNTVADIRYPHDSYDRIWRSDVYPDSTARYIPPPTTDVNITDPDNIMPPLQVLKTAVTHQERLEFQYDTLDAGSRNYSIYLYFLELNESVRVGERVFNVFINDKNMHTVDILASGAPFLRVTLNFTTNGVLNLTLVKASNSQLGPICNAYEIWQVYPRNAETNAEEVAVITKVKSELLAQNQDSEVLKTWSGDPCLPLPWHGLSCDAPNGTSIITGMDLSSNRLTGPLPSSITDLKYLKELNLSNNGFIGTVPQFPASSMLISLDVSHNELTGNITFTISKMKHLEKLYFGCNSHLTGSIPTDLSKSNLSTDNGVCNAQASSHSARILIGTIAAGSLLVIAIAVAGTCLFCIYKKKRSTLHKYDDKRQLTSKNAIYAISSTESVATKSISIQSFTLKCIEASIQNYKTLIGEGGFGSVYRGTLADGQEVAVKVRSATSTQGTREFDNELNLLSAIRHENLVPLIGYCCENDQQILVYPFMSNGSLQDRLYGAAAKRKVLDWPTRLSIALGAARGLTYLHTFSERCVIHRDVKSSNILLDHSMSAKVSDFGFSKYAPQEGDSGTSLEVRGTAGYLDPEYYSTQHLSAKSDVFSFGVVLLEIVSGREPLNINRPRNEWSLVEWAKPHIKNSKVEEIVDPSIKGGYHAEAMWRVVEVALACIEPYSAYRPCMADIVRELEDAFIIENNASEYMKSIESFGGSNRYSIERPIVIPPTPVPTEPSPILMQPPPPQPR